MGGERFEFIWGGDEGQVSQFGDFGGNPYIPADTGVQASAHGGATLGQFVNSRQGRLDAADAHGNLMRVSGKFLAQGQRRGVLGMGATNFDDVFEIIDLHDQGRMQLF